MTTTIAANLFPCLCNAAKDGYKPVKMQSTGRILIIKNRRYNNENFKRNQSNSNLG